ncbi:hypothetical protein QTP88_027004 [Uroleucon formosanum]
MKNVHANVPALSQPAAPIDARQSVIQFAPSVASQGDIQIAPQIFVPDIPAGGSNMLSEDEICMAAMDEYEEHDDNTDYTTTDKGKRVSAANTMSAAPIDARQSVIQIAPQIFVPDIPAGGSNMLSEDEICMTAMDEYEKHDDNTG